MFYCIFHLHGITFLSFPFSLCVSLALKWVSCKHHIEFLNKSSTLCLLVGAFIQLTFKVILIGMYFLLFCSVQLLSRVRLFATPWMQHTRPPCPSPTARVYSNSCPLSQWCHPTISSSVIAFSSCPQSFPASGFFQMSQFFASGGQNIGVSASASVLPMTIQDWFPLGWTGWISLLSKGLSRVFSNTTVQKHLFFGAQFS